MLFIFSLTHFNFSTINNKFDSKMSERLGTIPTTAVSNMDT